jgi:hypothetical protein
MVVGEVPALLLSCGFVDREGFKYFYYRIWKEILDLLIFYIIVSGNFIL